VARLQGHEMSLDFEGLVVPMSSNREPALTPPQPRRN